MNVYGQKKDDKKDIFKLSLIGDSLAQGSGADSFLGMKMPYLYIVKSLYAFILFKYFNCKLMISKILYGNEKYDKMQNRKYENYDVFCSKKNSAFLTAKKWGIQYKLRQLICKDIFMNYFTKTGLSFSTLNNRVDNILTKNADLLIVELGSNDFFLNISETEFNRNVEIFFKKLVSYNHYKIVAIFGLPDFLRIFHSNPETIMTYTPFLNKAISRKQILLNVPGGIAEDLNMMYPASEKNIEIFRIKNKSFEEIIKKYSLLLMQNKAFKGKVIYVDLKKEFNSVKNIDDYLSIDGLHFNKHGQKWLAEKLFNDLRDFIKPGNNIIPQKTMR
jgi:lysophospholipase L1-like esterase